MQNALMQIRS